MPHIIAGPRRRDPASRLSDAEICFIDPDQPASPPRLIDEKPTPSSVLQLIPASFPNQLRIAKGHAVDVTSSRQAASREDSTSSVRPATMKRSQPREIRTQSARHAGDVEDNVDADYTGEEMTIAFNPSFLIDGVEAVSGDEIVLEMSDSVRAAMVHGVDTTFDSATS